LFSRFYVEYWTACQCYAEHWRFWFITATSVFQCIWKQSDSLAWVIWTNSAHFHPGTGGRDLWIWYSQACLCVLASRVPAGKVIVSFPLTLWLKWLFSACCKRSRLLSHLLLTLHVPSGMQFLLINVSFTQSYKITYGQALPPEQCVFPLWDALRWIWQSQISTKSYSLLKPSIFKISVVNVCSLSWKIRGSVNSVYEYKMLMEYLLQQFKASICGKCSFTPAA